MKKARQTKIDVAKDLRSGRRKADIIASYRIHPVTLWRWEKKLREGGVRNLVKKRRYNRPWNKLPVRIESAVSGLKEANPALTIACAKLILAAKDIRISNKGIWNVWKRYGYAGFLKEKMGTVTDCRKYCAIDPETKEKIIEARAMFDNGNVMTASHHLNNMASCPVDDVLYEIPRNLLSLRRQADQLLARSGKVPLAQYKKSARILRKKLEKNKMLYTALRVAVEEGGALTFLEKSNELLKLTDAMKERVRGLRDPWVRSAILLLEGYALAGLLRVKDAIKSANRCKIAMKNLHHPYFMMGELTSIYYKLGKYREAIIWAKKALRGLTGDSRKDLYSSLVGYLTVSGDYHAIPKIVKEEKLDKWGYHTRILLIKAYYYLNKGDFQHARNLAEQALQSAKAEEIKAFFITAIFIIACCHAALGNKKKALFIIKKYYSLSKKFHLEREYYLYRIIVGDINLPQGAIDMPNLQLACLFSKARSTLCARDYRRVLRYARSQKLSGLFERLALFFPESILSQMKKGKNPGLPKRLLLLPAFQIDPPSYNVQYLGPLRIRKDEKNVRIKGLRPKEKAFLIQLATNKCRRIPLEALCCNFWPKTEKPSRHLSHVLVRIRKAFLLPAHLLRIAGNFISWDFYCNTDYEDFKELLAQAKALERAGEWHYARKEYARAFRLFRGAPFGKMYDAWSLDARHRILANLEAEIKGFLEKCREHHDEQEGQKLARRILPILPHLEGTA